MVNMKLIPIQTHRHTHKLYIHTYTLLLMCHTIFIWQVSEIQRFTNSPVRRSPSCIFTVMGSNIAFLNGGVLKTLVTWQCTSASEKISLISKKGRDRLREKDRERLRKRHREIETGTDRDRDYLCSLLLA